MRRHDLAWIEPSAWDEVLGSYAADPLIGNWAICDRPLVLRRSLPGEAPGVPLGLPTPPSDGKRRLGFLLEPEAVSRLERPPLLADVSTALPPSWHSIAGHLSQLEERHGVAVRVFGSAAFQFLTGLDYLTPSSDLDLLVEIGPATELSRLVGELARFAEQAPTRLDGEVMWKDGSACKWRELERASGPILIRTADTLSFDTPNGLRACGATT